MITGCLSQPDVEVLKNEPIVHPMVRTPKDVLLNPLPSFGNRLIRCLLEVQNPSSKSISFACRKELHEERLGAFVPGIHSSLVSIEPLFCSPHKREQKQTEPNCILRYFPENKSTIELQELLEMNASVLVGLATERASLHHRDKTRLDLEIFSSSVDLRSDRDLGSRGSRVIVKRLLGHSLRSCAGVTGSAVESEI